MEMSKSREEPQQQQQEHGQDTRMMEAGEVDESRKASIPKKPTPPPAPKAEELVTLARKQTFLKTVSDDEDMSEDDLDDEYFEQETARLQRALGEVIVKNTLEVFKSVSIPFTSIDGLASPQIPPPMSPIIPGRVPSPVREEPTETPAPKDDEPMTTVFDETLLAQPAPVAAKQPTPPAAIAKSVEITTPSDGLAELVLEPKLPPTARLSAAVPEDVEIDDEHAREQAEAIEHVRKRMTTPAINTLPFRPATPLHDDGDIMHAIESLQINAFDADANMEIEDFIVDSESAKLDEWYQTVKKNADEYRKNYKSWILFHRSQDPLAVKCRQKWQNNLEAEVSRAASAAPDKDGSEGTRRKGRFATEMDIERVLKISELEAREKKAKSDKAVKDRLKEEKEAVIPDMLSPEDRGKYRFGNYTNKVDRERALVIFEVLPPIPDFTPQEKDKFEATMLEYPKQWGKVANQLPGRNYKHVIQYYYLVKHALKLKEKLKRGTKGRRKRKPKASVNTVTLARDDEVDDPPVVDEGGTRRRPKRAAAPTFGAEPVPSESDTTTTAPSSGRGRGANKETNGDTPAPGKRKKGIPREKGTKAAKNNAQQQLLAQATNNSAQAKNKAEARIEPQPAIKPNIDWSQGPPRSGPPPAETVYAPNSGPQTFAPQDASPLRTMEYQPQGVIVDRPPPHIAPHHDIPVTYAGPDHLGPMPLSPYDQQQNQRNNSNSGAPTSSYWSVAETQDFPMLLEHFGTDWHGIAKWMASKTHIMVYTTVFSDWLTVPSDSNKSRLVANLAEQVKNYYQRQVDTAGRADLEMIAKAADEKKARGESTGPPPQPSSNPVKRKYDGLPGSPNRPLGAMGPDELEEMYSNGPAQQQPPLKFGSMPGTGRFDSYIQTPSRAGALGAFDIGTKGVSQHGLGSHEPSPQPGGQRFLTLAQGPASDARSQPPNAKIMPHQGQPQHMQHQMQPQMQHQMQPQQRGPRLGYFNNVSSETRPILSARSSNNSAPHGSPAPADRNQSQHMVAKAARAAEEAQAEHAKAVRLQEEERARLGSMGRMKVEPEHMSPVVRDMPNFDHHAQQGMHGVPPQHRMGQRLPHEGGIQSQPISPSIPEERGRPMSTYYGYQGQQQQVQSQRMDPKMGSVTTGPSTPVIAAHAPLGVQQGMVSRGNTMSAPPQQQHPHVVPHHHHLHSHGGAPQRGPAHIHGQPQPPQLSHQHQQGQDPRAQDPRDQLMQQQEKRPWPPQHMQQPSSQQSTPVPARTEPVRKSNVFSLLNNDEPAAAKTPQPQMPRPTPSPVPQMNQGYGAPSGPPNQITRGPPPPRQGMQHQGHQQGQQYSQQQVQQSGQQHGQQQGPPQNVSHSPPRVLNDLPYRRSPKVKQAELQSPRTMNLALRPSPTLQQAQLATGEHLTQSQAALLTSVSHSQRPQYAEQHVRSSVDPRPPVQRAGTMPLVPQVQGQGQGQQQQHRQQMRVDNPNARVDNPNANPQFMGERQQAQGPPSVQQARSHAGSIAGSPIERLKPDPYANYPRGGTHQDTMVRCPDGSVMTQFAAFEMANTLSRHDVSHDQGGPMDQFFEELLRREAEMLGRPMPKGTVMQKHIEAKGGHEQQQHQSGLAVNSPQVRNHYPQAPPPAQQQQQQPQFQHGLRGTAYGREQLGHGSRGNSFDGRQAGMTLGSQAQPAPGQYVAVGPNGERQVYTSARPSGPAYPSRPPPYHTKEQALEYSAPTQTMWGAQRQVVNDRVVGAGLPSGGLPVGDAVAYFPPLPPSTKVYPRQEPSYSQDGNAGNDPYVGLNRQGERQPPPADPREVQQQPGRYQKEVEQRQPQPRSRPWPPQSRDLLQQGQADREHAQQVQGPRQIQQNPRQPLPSGPPGQPGQRSYTPTHPSPIMQQVPGGPGLRYTNVDERDRPLLGREERDRLAAHTAQLERDTVEAEQKINASHPMFLERVERTRREEMEMERERERERTGLIAVGGGGGSVVERERLVDMERREREAEERRKVGFHARSR